MRSVRTLLAALLLALPLHLPAADYTITKLVIETTVAADFAINDNGDVAYTSRSPSNIQELYVRIGNTARKIIDSSGEYSSLKVTSLNNQGVVAFVATRKSGGDVVAIGSTAGVTVIAPNVYALNANPQINDRGEVAFLAG